MKPKVEINKGKGKTASVRKKDVTTSSVVAVRQESSLAERVIELIEAARQKVATVANVAERQQHRADP